MYLFQFFLFILVLFIVVIIFVAVNKPQYCQNNSKDQQNGSYCDIIFKKIRSHCHPVAEGSQKLRIVLIVEQWPSASDQPKLLQQIKEKVLTFI